LPHPAPVLWPPDSTSLFAVMFCTIMVPYDMCFEPPKGKIMTGVDIAIEAFFISEMVIFLLAVDLYAAVSATALSTLDLRLIVCL
jgi:hypothetical protein